VASSGSGVRGAWGIRSCFDCGFVVFMPLKSQKLLTLTK
jgi:hypothetical protein